MIITMRKVKFLGIEFEVMDADEQADVGSGSLYVMQPIGEHDGSSRWSPQLALRVQRRRCDACHAVCWYDPASYGALPAGLRKICTACYIATGGQ
jgi:hypothetical protein